ncbi:MAG: HAD family phosphatase, partial [Gloeobacterales cyanobacterium]
PYYLLLDRMNRDRFIQVFYRNYRGFFTDDCQQRSQILFQEMIYPQLRPGAIECITQHKAQGRQIVLVTGSLDFIVAPLAEFLGAKTLTSRLKSDQGHYTGELLGASMIGEEKAKAIRQMASDLSIDLQQSYAYGDSAGDLPMLDTVAYPVAVNPDIKLRRVAQQRGWTIEEWKPPQSRNYLHLNELSQAHHLSTGRAQGFPTGN